MRNNSWELPISEHDLTGLTDAVNDVQQRPPSLMSRRALLISASGAAAALAVAGCSGPAKKPGPSRSGSGSGFASSPPPSKSSSPSAYPGELRLVALATALENQVISAYTLALKAANAGKLGTVPAAVTTFLATAVNQHSDHAKTWNQVLTNAGKPTISGTPLANQPQLTQELNALGNVSQLLRLALALEDQAAQTYVSTASAVASQTNLGLAITIAPVEAMHAAVLSFLLGEYPIPNVALPVDKAASETLLTV